MFYSATTNAFYPPEFRGRYQKTGTWPDDAKEVDDSVFVEYSGTPPSGKVRITNGDGNPAWEDVPALSLNDQRTAAANGIRTDFNASIQQPVPANSATWNGGMDSALAIDGAVRLAEQIGQTSIELFDFDNAAHTVSIETGKQIAAAVGVDYQAKLARKQQLLRDIATADVAQLKSISW